MKVQELFEALVDRNKKIGYDNDRKIFSGQTKEWLKTIGATPTHIEDAMRKLKQTAEYRAVLAQNMTEDSSDRELANGTLTFVGIIDETGFTKLGDYSRGSPRPRRLKYKVLASGKIDAVQANDYHRYAVSAPKPRIVPGDPVGSIVKTMSASLEKLASTLEKRRKAAANANAKAAKLVK